MAEAVTNVASLTNDRSWAESGPVFAAITAPRNRCYGPLMPVSSTGFLSSD